MSFCDHCEGQRFDRARVLRVLRATRKDLRKHGRARADDVLKTAIAAIRALEIPHLEIEEELTGDEVIH